MARRSPGTGSVLIRSDTAGRETFYGKWTTPAGRQVKRRLGPRRPPGSSEGLTHVQAEAELRRVMGETTAVAPVRERLTIAQLAEHYRRDLVRQGRKPSTLIAFESVVRVHLAPFFADRAVESITHADVADLVAVLEQRGLAPKSIANYIGTLSALFNFAAEPRRGWVSANPCRGADLPAVPDCSEIRFLELDDVEALIAGVQPGPYEAIDRALYRTAAMTGLRQGELIALRWRDVDWRAARIRVRQNYVRGQFGTPKSRRSTRSVPMADVVGGELDRLYRVSATNGDDELVFADPHTGGPLERAAILRRFGHALRAARLEARRFHEYADVVVMPMLGRDALQTGLIAA